MFSYMGSLTSVPFYIPLISSIIPPVSAIKKE